MLQVPGFDSNLSISDLATSASSLPSDSTTTASSSSIAPKGELRDQKLVMAKQLYQTIAQAVVTQELAFKQLVSEVREEIIHPESDREISTAAYAALRLLATATIDMQAKLAILEQERSEAKKAAAASSIYNDIINFLDKKTEHNPLHEMSPIELFDLIHSNSPEPRCTNWIYEHLKHRIKQMRFDKLVEFWKQVSKKDVQIANSLFDYFAERLSDLIYEAGKNQGEIKKLIDDIIKFKLPFPLTIKYNFPEYYKYIPLFNLRDLATIEKIEFTSYHWGRNYEAVNDFRTLREFPLLKEICIDHAIEENQFIGIVDNTPHLKKLRVQNSHITNDQLLDFAQRNPENYLDSFSICNWLPGGAAEFSITNQGITDLLKTKKLSRSTSIELALYQIDFDLMKALASLRCLTSLKISYRKGMSQDVVSELNLLADAEAFPSLETLELKDPEATNEIIMNAYFILGVTNLTLNCPRITHAFLDDLGQQKPPKLKVLNLINMNRISEEDRIRLKEAMPELRIT